MTQRMVRPCVARGFPQSGGCAVLDQCIRPLIVAGGSSMWLPRLSSGNLRDQLFDDGIGEGIEVLRDHDERAVSADDVVAIVICKSARRVGVGGIGNGW